MGIRKKEVIVVLGGIIEIGEGIERLVIKIIGGVGRDWIREIVWMGKVEGENEGKDEIKIEVEGSRVF